MCASPSRSDIFIADSNGISAICLRDVQDGAPAKRRRAYIDDDGLSAKGMAVHPLDGSLVVAATNQNCVLIFSSDGSDDDDDEDSRIEGFGAPMDVAVALDGTIYVADFGNDRIQIISRPPPTPPGESDDEFFPTEVATLSQVSTPKALCLDERWGRLFVAGGSHPESGGCISMIPVPTRAERLDPVMRCLLLSKHHRACVKSGLYVLQTLESELAQDVYLPGFPASLPVGRLVLWYAVEVVCDRFQLSTCLPTWWIDSEDDRRELFDQFDETYSTCELCLPRFMLEGFAAKYSLQDVWVDLLTSANFASPRTTKGLELLTALREPGIVAKIIGFAW